MGENLNAEIQIRYDRAEALLTGLAMTTNGLDAASSAMRTLQYTAQGSVENVKDAAEKLKVIIASLKMDAEGLRSMTAELKDACHDIKQVQETFEIVASNMLASLKSMKRKSSAAQASAQGPCQIKPRRK